MIPFRYPGNKPFIFTKETIQKTPYTFSPDGNIWEPYCISYFYNLVEEKHNNKNAVIVDVGAQTGLYTLYAKYLPECRFYAFEPFEDTYKILLNNLRANNITNVKAYNYAVGSQDEKKILHVPDHLGLNTLGDKPVRFANWKDVEVQVVKLDDIFTNETSMDYIKCDTEGWEYHVLKGAEESIRKWKPELMIEIFQDNLKQCGLTEDTLRDYLKSLDYKEVSHMDGENVHFRYEQP